MEKIVLQHLTQDKAIQTKSVSCKNKDIVIINCTDEENLNSFVHTLGGKLSNNFEIEKEQINNQKLKVIDIDMDHADDTEIELDINERNFSNIEDKCKLLHVYTNERTKRKCVIIEVTSAFINISIITRADYLLGTKVIKRLILLTQLHIINVQDMDIVVKNAGTKPRVQGVMVIT